MKIEHDGYLIAPNGAILTKITAGGELYFIARQIGMALGYSKNGWPFVVEIAGHGFSEARGDIIHKIFDFMVADYTAEGEVAPLGTPRKIMLVPHDMVVRVISRSKKKERKRLTAWFLSEIQPRMQDLNSYVSKYTEPLNQEDTTKENIMGVITPDNVFAILSEMFLAPGVSKIAFDSIATALLADGKLEKSDITRDGTLSIGGYGKVVRAIKLLELGSS